MQHDPKKTSDTDIVQQVVDGNVNAFEILLDRHKEAVLRIVNRRLPAHDVEETAQEVFVRAYCSLPTFKGTGSFSHWLSSIAVKTCYDYWRKAYRKKEVPLSELTDRHRQWLESVTAEQSQEICAAKGYRNEAREVLDFALAGLSAEDRAVIELVYFEGYSVKEAAASLGWSMPNVKVRSFRARKKLEKTLTKLISRYARGRCS